nr:hypothetical protein Iba_chr04dCG4010 [Ipomoea batatas]
MMIWFYPTLGGMEYVSNHSQRQFEMVVPISCKHCLYQHNITSSLSLT